MKRPLLSPVNFFSRLYAGCRPHFVSTFPPIFFCYLTDNWFLLGFPSVSFPPVSRCTVATSVVPSLLFSFFLFLDSIWPPSSRPFGRAQSPFSLRFSFTFSPMWVFSCSACFFFFFLPHLGCSLFTFFSEVFFQAHLDVLPSCNFSPLRLLSLPSFLTTISSPTI